jgi:arylsulfatase A-like enzyme
MKRNSYIHPSGFLIAALLAGSSAYAQFSPTPTFQGTIGKTLTETKESRPQTQPKAPDGAPNVVWILIDDIGFGAIDAFGGLIETPNIDKLASNGLRYTNYHTAAFCAPTRAALLTGRNTHSVHFGFFATPSYNTPGYDGYLPFEKATAAEVLRENGYSTFAVGKYHLTHPSDASQAGPFNRWPTGRGFDHYFGFPPETWGTDQWHPTLYRDTQREPEDAKGRHVNELLADEAIAFISNQKAAAPDKPFFLYFAPGVVHAPIQAPKEWIDVYKGKFDSGWDKYRELVLKNQKDKGLVPADVTLAQQNPGVKPWDQLTANEKKLFARHMEAYAGFVSYTDHEIGRVIDFIEKLGQLDNTLIAVIVGDNGAEGGGREIGRFLPHSPDETPEQKVANEVKNLEKLGTENSSALYPDGWAAATNTPFRYYKSYASYEGGTRDGLILFYPKRIKDKGGIRNQYSYVNDILPTTIELAGVKVPTVVNGYPQEPIEGTSLAYTIEAANKNLPERHTIQYHEMTNGYAIYKDGWKASLTRDKGKRIPVDQEKWRLYNTKEDFNEQHDLANKYPDKLKELQDAFDAEAWKYNVYPLKDTWVATNNNTFDNVKKIVLRPGNYFTSSAAPKFQANSYAITANAEISANGNQGVLLSVGSSLGGISFYVKDKKLVFAYNADGKLEEIRSSTDVPTGKVDLKVEVTYSNEGKNKALTIFINGAEVGKKDLGKISSAGPGVEGLEVGKDIGLPVSTAYKAPFAFTGKLNDVTIELKDDNTSARNK